MRFERLEPRTLLAGSPQTPAAAIRHDFGQDPVALSGTAGDDVFELLAPATPSGWAVKINGVLQDVDSLTVRVAFDGLSGHDAVWLTGTDGNEALRLWADRAILEGVGFAVNVIGVESIAVQGLGGSDQAAFYDTRQDDTFVAWPGGALMAGQGVDARVDGFESILAQAELGGYDVVKLYDSAGDDLLVTTPVYAALSGEGFQHQARHFDAVHAYATAGGFDVARMYDSAASDAFYASPVEASLYGDGAYNRAKFFEQVHAFATGGGADDARFLDSTGDDVFYGSPLEASLYSTDAKGFYRRAKFFESVTAEATAGGADEARLQGSDGNDLFVATPVYGGVSGEGFVHGSWHFERVVAAAAGDGYDVAKFYDSAGDDLLVTTPVYAALSGEGFQHQARHFDAVHAYATAGGFDVARMYDSAASDAFYASPVEASLHGDGAYNRAKFFEQVHAFATAGGADEARLLDSPGDDHFYGSPLEASLYGDGFYNRAKFFEVVRAEADGGHDQADLEDSGGDDVLWANPTQAALSGNGFCNRVNGFEVVRACATNEGYDVARLFGSEEDDVLEASRVECGLFRLGHFQNRAKYFDEVFADANGGQRDRAFLFELTKLGSQGDWTEYADQPADVRCRLADFEDTRSPTVRPTDRRENFDVAATYGLDRIEEILRAEDVLIVPCDGLETAGFSMDLFTSRRWPHVKRDDPNGSVWVRAPRAGRYHAGFTMYDDACNERVGLYIEGEFFGVAVAGEDNNRDWLYWLEQPYEFQGGECVELRSLGGEGKCGISSIVFLPRPPAEQEIEHRVENMRAATYVDHPGRVTLSWTTTWPCPTRFEYGPDQSYGTLVEDGPEALVHRVVLEDLDPSATYHGRAVGYDRHGKAFYGDDFGFRAVPPEVPQTVAGTHQVPLTVSNPHPFAVEDWPTSSGVPFPEGQLGSIEQVRLVCGGLEVPAQFRAIARWPDASIKSLLVTFLAEAPAGGEGRYVVEYGRDVRRRAVPEGLLLREDGNGLEIDTGAICFRIDAQGNLTDFHRGAQRLLQPDCRCHTLALDVRGSQYDTRRGRAEITVEEAGPLRAVVAVVSHLTDPDGRPLLRVEKRVEAYRHAAWLRIVHTVVFDGPQEFTDLERLTFRVPVGATGSIWRVPLQRGSAVVLGDEVQAVRQRFDDEFVTVSGDRETPSRGRIAGAIRPLGGGLCTVALRDFWENYPKAFRVGPEGLDVELCPSFPAGLYDQFPFEQQEHHLYYYLLDGRYRLKQGTSKSHELLLSFEPQGRAAELCSLLQEPPLATAPPEWYCSSKVFYDVAPRDPVDFRSYEEAIDRNLQAYLARQQRQHDYGMLNYGDWYGERGSNWGNAEYDTQHAFFLEYIRSGHPQAFFLAEAAELHNRDVDTVQWSPDPHQLGAVYVHQMGHVGEYYDHGVPGMPGVPQGGFTVSHAWVEGHFDHWYLTGDRRSFETGCAVADYFTRLEFGRPYDFANCRIPGWHLIMLVAAYQATGDPFYLNAAKLVVQRVLETQQTQPCPLPCQAQGPSHLGGWPHMMFPGHCECQPRHRGNAGFMVAILLSGLKYYQDLTGEAEVKQSIIRGAHYLLDACYVEQVHGFRYTSCPHSWCLPGATWLMLEGIARAYLWTGEERFHRVLTESPPLEPNDGYGGEVSACFRSGPRVLADLRASGIHLG